MFPQISADSYVLNGQGYGGAAGAAFNVTNRMAGGRFDPGLLRPFIETDPNSPMRGRPCAQVLTGRMIYNNQTGEHIPERKKYLVQELQAMGINSPVFNAVVFTREDWVAIDRAVERATRQPLSAWNDLRAANTRGGFNAWTQMTLEYTAVTDAGEVVKDMDATSPGRNDTPLNLIRSIPLPVIHGDFEYPQRLIDIARSKGQPIDAEMIEQITRRGWECVEKTLIGTETGITWGTRSTGPFPHTGTSTEYGYTNFTHRVTKTDLTTPDGTNQQAILTDVQEMIETMNGNGYYGPFVLYHSTPYSIRLNDDYVVGTVAQGLAGSTKTLRSRLLELDSISSIRRLNYLTTGYQLILVDLNRGQFQAIDGMQPRTVQWSERGGMIQKFMVMMIQVALLRAPYNGVPALIHGTTS